MKRINLVPGFAWRSPIEILLRSNVVVPIVEFVERQFQQLRGSLARRGQAPVEFTAQRQMSIYFGVPRSTCSMVGVVTYALGGDIAKWLQKPVDAAKLGEL